MREKFVENRTSISNSENRREDEALISSNVLGTCTEYVLVCVETVREIKAVVRCVSRMTLHGCLVCDECGLCVHRSLNCFHLISY